MAEQVDHPRNYSAAAGRFELGLAGFWVVIALLNSLIGDRVFTAFCLVSALGSGLAGANDLWWRGSNRWFKPAMLLVIAGMAAFVVVFVARMFRG